MATAKGDKKQQQDTEVREQEPVQETVRTEDIDTAPMVIVPQAEVDAIVRKRIYASMALGLAPVPLLDLVGLTAVQIELVHALAKRYEVPFKKNVAKALIGSLVGGVLPVGVAPLFASLVKVVPVIGLTTGAASMCILGGASTYAVGKIFARHFAAGGTLLDIKAEQVRDSFKEQFDKGKKLVSSMKKDKEAATEQESADTAQPETAKQAESQPA
jgi:uncharacterized protein (DUF697 family)